MARPEETAAWPPARRRSAGRSNYGACANDARVDVVAGDWSLKSQRRVCWLSSGSSATAMCLLQTSGPDCQMVTIPIKSCHPRYEYDSETQNRCPDSGSGWIICSTISHRPPKLPRMSVRCEQTNTRMLPEKLCMTSCLLSNPLSPLLPGTRALP